MPRKNFSDDRPHFGFMSETSYYTPDRLHWPVVDWRPPRLEDMPCSLRGATICLDVEVRDEQLKILGPGCRRDPTKNYVVGYGLAIEDGPEFYLPTRHHGGDNCEWDVRGWMRDQLRGFDGTLVLNGGGYDLDWIATDLQDEAILDIQDIDDVQIRDPLIYELHDRYGLDELCLRYQIPGKDETLLREAASLFRIDPKKELWKLPARFVSRYGAIDARRPLQVRRRQIPKMHEEGVEKIWRLEKQVTAILVKMRRLGVRIDREHLMTIWRMSEMKEQEHLAEVRRETGITILPTQVWNAKALAYALKSAGYQVPKTDLKERVSEKTGKVIKSGGNDSVDQEFLAKCGKVGKNILRARKWNKLRTTFCKGILEHMVGDRIHCTFNQLKTTDDDGGDDRGVRYGRLSSDDPNMQFQPIRDDEFGEIFRRIFVAEHGERFGSSDWSQQEPRIGVHYAEIIEEQSGGRECRGAKEFGDEYRRNPKLDIHQKLTDLADDPINYPRKIVKNFVNGRLYGMGDTKLCHHLGWETVRVWDHRNQEYREYPTEESKRKIEQFVRFAPWIPGLTQAAKRQAEKNGHVWSLLRRKFHFPIGPDGKMWKIHAAFNRIGQGTAADQMKACLVECWRSGHQVRLSVHDEFDFSFSDIRTAIAIRDIQRDTVKLRVPMNVDLEIGPSWGQLEKYAA